MKKLLAVVLVVGLSIGFTGCGKKADETKPIDEVKAEAQKMKTGNLQDMVACYKDAITAKEKDIKATQAKMEALPMTPESAEKAKALTKDLSSAKASVSALCERMEIYKTALVEKTAEAAKTAKTAEVAKKIAK
jgi:hypothetical protein